MSQNTFKIIGIPDYLLKSIDEIGYKSPTEIQSLVIPYLLEFNSDLVGQAQTGTGKTAAFSIPIINRVDSNNTAVQALILAPTRELCQQIQKEIFKLTKYTNGVFSTAVFGGEKIEIQLSKLSRPTQIIVATPGRLIDLLDRNAINLNQVNTVVLDEADEMLKLGFQKDVETILKRTHLNSFTWLFSATIPNNLEVIISNYLSKDAKRFQISKKNTVNLDIEHQYFICQPKIKIEYLQMFLKTQPKKNGIFFTRTKASAQFVYDKLLKNHLNVGVLHGDLMQSEREKMIRMFKKGTLQYLVCTDIAARGIDVKGLSFVLHYELPDDIENYTHRSGRTGRAGNKGISIAFIEKSETKKIFKIESLLNIKFNQIK
jgi:ATP-dependent RNA helicase DeaD